MVFPCACEGRFANEFEKGNGIKSIKRRMYIDAQTSPRLSGLGVTEVSIHTTSLRMTTYIGV